MVIKFKADHTLVSAKNLYKKIVESNYNPAHIVLVVGDGLIPGFLISKEFNAAVHVANIEQDVYSEIHSHVANGDKVLVIDAANSTGNMINEMKRRWGNVDNLRFAVITQHTDVDTKADYFVHVHDDKVEFFSL